MFDTTAPVEIGAGFDGRIYSVELRDGLDPNTPVTKYLTPTVGTVYTDDPGPLPNQCCLVARARFTSTIPAGGFCSFAAQWEVAGQSSWLWRFWLPNGFLHPHLSSDGTNSFEGDAAPGQPPDLDADRWYAFTLNQRTSDSEFRSLKSSDGVVWSQTGVGTVPVTGLFDSSSIMRVGAWAPGAEPLPGRLYSVELRTGLDPASTARYLTPTVGTVTTPDPGPLPPECTFVFKVQGPNAANGTIAAQFSDVGTMSYIVFRLTNGAFYVTRSTDGSTGVDVALGTGMAVGPDAQYGAVSINTPTGQLQSWTSPDGSAWSAIDTQTSLVSPLFDSAAPLRIGGYGVTGGNATWDDRIYSVELRTGLDPAAGTVLWRFDADEAPTDATTT
ncbi:MAG TPA: hypothetical protein VIQ02_11690, partial [Jiangellaceae bacterium]